MRAPRSLPLGYNIQCHQKTWRLSLAHSAHLVVLLLFPAVHTSLSLSACQPMTHYSSTVCLCVCFYVCVFIYTCATLATSTFKKVNQTSINYRNIQKCVIYSDFSACVCVCLGIGFVLRVCVFFTHECSSVTDGPQTCVFI